MFLPTFAGLLAGISIFNTVTAHNIQLRAHSRECFHEELHKDDKMTVTYQVGDREFGGSSNLDIDFYVSRQPSKLGTETNWNRSPIPQEVTKLNRNLFRLVTTVSKQEQMENTSTVSATKHGAPTAKRFRSMCTAWYTYLNPKLPLIHLKPKYANFRTSLLRWRTNRHILW